jgi:predicted nucleic acid-binding protein
MFLLDTNAVAEPGRRSPDARFMAWFDSIAAEQLFISTITVGEMKRGIALVDDDARRGALEAAYADLVTLFSERLLPLDVRVAEVWGNLSARLRRAGRTSGAPDEIIAATALAHDLTVVTRNTRDFEASGCRLLCPWAERG